MDYSDQVVIITGTTSGIGNQLALDFADRKAKIVMAARRADRLEEVAKLCRDRGAEVEIVVGDISQRAFCETVVNQAKQRFGKIDILVNNAGIPKHKQFFDMTA